MGPVLGEEGGDSRLVLGESGNEMEKLDVPGNDKGGSGLSNPGLAGDLCCGEHGSFEPSENLPGIDARARVDPVSCQSRSEGGRLSDPLGDAGKWGKKGGKTVEGERDGKMIGKAGAGDGEGTIVGRVVEDGDVGGDKRVGKEGRGDKEAIEPGGPGVGGQGVGSEVKISEGGMRDIRDREPCFETSPEREKRGRGRCEGACGVLGVLNEVKVAAEESGDGGINFKHGTDQIFANEGFALPSFEVDVEELERLMGGCTGHVAPQLDMTFEVGWEGNVCRLVIAENGWGVNNSGARLVHSEVVERDGGARDNG